MSEYHNAIYSDICEQKSLSLGPNSKLHYNHKKAFQWMRTDCAVTRLSIALVAIRLIVNRMTDTRLWTLYSLAVSNNHYIFFKWCCFHVRSANIRYSFRGGSRIPHRRRRQPYRVRQHTILPNFPHHCMILRNFWVVKGAFWGRP